MSDYFYGWYFRCQGKEGTFAVIPAVHMSGTKEACSIQILTESGTWHKQFPMQQFRINRSKGIMQIGENLFSRKGIWLNLHTETLEIHGLLRFGPFSEPEYDIMGPFRFLPWMECRHAVYSMEHSVDGSVEINGRTLSFSGGRGYMGGDSGTSFPANYIWTQHFLDKGCIMLAAATIPLMGFTFTGTTGILRWNGREYRFATYLGASVIKMKDGELAVRQGKFLLWVRLPESDSENRGRSRGGSSRLSDVWSTAACLKAPSQGKMTRQIRENLSGRAEYMLFYREKLLLHVKTECAAAEYETKEEEHENNSHCRRKDQREISQRRYLRIHEKTWPVL